MGEVLNPSIADSCQRDAQAIATGSASILFISMIGANTWPRMITKLPLNRMTVPCLQCPEGPQSHLSNNPELDQGTHPKERYIARA